MIEGLVKRREQLELRGSDPMGSGAWGAPRGDRKHRGIDYAAPVGTEILSPVRGTVTKLGYVYASDLRYRYVEVEDATTKLRHRVFYIEPRVRLFEYVYPDTVIGIMQDIAGKWPGRGMVNHVHYEVMDRDTRERFNPEEVDRDRTPRKQ